MRPRSHKALQAKSYLSRAVTISLYRDGTFVHHYRETQTAHDGALPVFSVDDAAEAENLKVMLCKKTYDPNRPSAPPNWRIPFPDTEDSSVALAALEAAGHMIADTWASFNAGKRGMDLGIPLQAYKKQFALP